ncbi:MAG: HDOD domain-containing protein [Opitutaceae bacterium]
MTSSSSVTASLVGKPVRAARLSPALLTSYLGEMPVAPAVLPRLQSLLLSDSFETNEVLELVRIDPGLAARLIHAAGSAACARGEPVRSLDEALFRLGAHEAYRLTATVAMSQFLNTPLQVYGIDPHSFWRQSVACALAMVDLAPAASLDDRVAYTIGLLHALGMVFIDHHLRVTSGPLTQVHGNRSLDQQEIELTGMSHAAVAAFILRSWNVAEEVVEPIEFQFNPGRAPRHRAMALLLAEARTLAQDIVHSLPAPGSHSQAPTGNPWIDEIGVHIRQIESW